MITFPEWLEEKRRERRRDRIRTVVGVAFCVACLGAGVASCVAAVLR